MITSWVELSADWIARSFAGLIMASSENKACARDRRTQRRIVATAAAFVMSFLLIASAPCAAQTIVGENLAFRSNGTNAGTDWQLMDNGYVGTYVNLAAPGDVTIAVQATGQADGGFDPHMNIVVADTSASFNVTAGATNTYQSTFSLPAGTHFVRTEFTNDPEQSSRSLQIVDLNVSGATLVNSATNDNALAAANTYIENFRKGPANLQLVGVQPGTPVDITLKRHEFNFGTTVGGQLGINTYLGTPTPGSRAENFQQALVDTKINALVPENAGKWASNSIIQSFHNLDAVDQMLDFVEDHNMRARMHNLIWDNQQPNWVDTLIAQAAGGDANSLNSLRTAISERIDYYVGDGDEDQNDGDRSQRYFDLDVLNESVHAGTYKSLFGVEGIAEIYSEVAGAVSDAGASTRLATNEFNVLQDNFGDFYGNWYRQEIEGLNTAGFGQVVTSIGVQSYENNEFGNGGGAHNPSRKMQTLQNLSVLGLPITLTEFGVKDPTSEADAAQMMEETMRIVFGTPNADGFFMWGIYGGDIFRGAAALYRSDWSLTPAGELWIDLMSIDSDPDQNDDWHTELSALVDPGGGIAFDGFYGDYEITIGDETFDLTLTKGIEEYRLVVPEPSAFVLLLTAAMAMVAGRRRVRGGGRLTH